MFTSSVKAQEASGAKGPFGLFGKSYALAITVIIDDSHPLEKEMRIINEHYIEWLKRRGKNCVDFVLGFTAPPNSEEAILTQCRRLLMQDAGDEKTLAAMNFNVVVVNSETEESKEYVLKWEPNARPDAEVPRSEVSNAPVALGITDPSFSDKEVLLFSEDDKEFALAIEEAQSRIAEFKALLNSPQAGVTVRIPWVCDDIRDIYEAALVGRKGDELEVEFTPDYAPGPVRKTYGFDEILDWTVHHKDGTVTGGFTERALLKD
jgi:hypothetical protein